MLDTVLQALACVVAGLLSFLSPCVLPLIPSYLCVVGGSAPNTDGGTLKPRVVAGTASFVLGFSAVFITLSIIFAATFSLMGGATRWIGWISGAVVIVLGLNLIFNFISFLNYEKRPFMAGQAARQTARQIARPPRGIVGAFLTGAAFGAGWTPCVGPVLAGILLMAAQSGGIPRAAAYLACYSAGLALPFLLASFFFSAFVKASEKLRARLPAIQKASGVLLVALGVLIVTGRYQQFSALAASWQPKAPAINAADDSSVQMVLISDGADSTGNSVAASAFSPETIRLFAEAGLPFVQEGINPIDFTLPLPDGTTQTLSSLKGNVVFLNFWATWCPPCRQEMPSMESLYQRLKDRGLVMLAVNLRESAGQVSDYLRANRLTFPSVMDRTGGISGRYGVQAIPTTYIFDRRGLIVSRLVGSTEWDRPEIVAALESLLRD
jgi:cytochrome c-type biogenesis protein